MFLSNAMSIELLQEADLYRNRWQIEPFFKLIKQYLKIRKFWGVIENAVRIRIATAITAYRLVAIVQKMLESKRTNDTSSFRF